MSIQDSLSTFATAIGNAIKPFKYIPAKPAAAGQYELAVNAQGQASWAAPAPAAAATPAAMDYAYMTRNGDQTNVRLNTPILFNQQVNSNAVDNPNGFSISTATNDLIFWPTGYVELKANRTYLLRATLYLNIPNGFNGRLGYAYNFGSNSFSPVHQGFGASFWGTGGSNIQCVSVEHVFRPTVNEQLWFVITSASDGTTGMTVRQGSTAFVQRIA